jgi:MFS transporter, PAT family, beta-lactamase induction signal transducer AmpG
LPTTPSGDPRVDSRARVVTHPSIFLALNVPYGAMSGYLTVAIAYALAQSGMSVARIGLLIATYGVPQTLKFLWAPIIDTTLTRKRWYFIGTSLTAAGAVAMAACSTRATAFGVLTVASLVASLASSFSGMSVESLLAHSTPEPLKGRAGGWLQAGAFAGGGIGGGAALWLAQRVSAPWLTGVALAACFMLCCTALLTFDEPHIAHESRAVGRKLIGVLRDLWQVVRVRSGYLALLIVFLPIGTGAASNFWSAVADEWHASAATVALVNGALSGIVCAAGCLLGGSISDRINRRFAYVLFGSLLALCGLAMAVYPHTERAYSVFTLTYAFINGMCFAGFSAVTLEAIGRGAAATKYNLYASLSNMPINYMTALEGWAHSRWGTNGLLYFEGIMSAVSLFIFGAAILLSAQRIAPPAPESA